MQPRQDPTPRPGFYVLKTDGGITAEQGQAAGPAAIGVTLKDHKYRDVDEISKQIGWAKNHSEKKSPVCGAFAEPSDGLEPSTPSLPFSSDEERTGKRGKRRPRKSRKQEG
jgi:hypothetical protein